MKVKVTNIDWDTDGNAVTLPNSMEIKFADNIQKDELEGRISDFLSDELGFCHFGFDYSVIE